MPRLPIQYGDYAEWQREWLRSGEMQSQLEYWQQQLKGELPVLELPTDHPRPPVATLRGGRRRFTIAPSVAARLKTFCRAEGVTLFMASLAAFTVLLRRYSGQDDVIIGSLTANRSRVETEGLIGIFINAVPLRPDLSGDPTFRELVQRVRETAIGAYAHQDIPFERLVEALHPERDPARAPVYQAMLNVDSGGARTLMLPGLVSEDLLVPHDAALLDLTMVIRERPEGMTGSLEYNADLFEEATVERMLDSFQVLLAGALECPDTKVSELPILTAEDRQRILVEWNRTDRPYPRESGFAALFEAQAARTPDRIAAAFRDETITYRLLNERANRAARLLRRRGTGKDRIVGLLFDRGLDFLTAILSVFKAGGAYLPLDPAHPVERIRDIVVRSGLETVLTSARLQLLASEASAGIQNPPAAILFDESTGKGESAENPPPAAGPENLAYVIFTSGSTGAPKGAMIEHRGMVNHLYAKIADLELSAADTVAQTASQCFDISVWQFLAPLLVGGRVVVLDDETAHDPARLLDGLEREGVSIAEVVPSLLQAMLESEATSGTRRLPALRWMIATGEALSGGLAREWLRVHAGIPLLNAYGPTECSDDVTHHAISVAPPESAATVPIGRPIANTRLYVLDEGRAPVPVQVAGELFVGGDGVGRGYLNDADRTAEAFVADPFASAGPARLYRTGDLVRYAADGTIQFVGRIDHQVKLRGYRIELGEIESALSACAGVARAVCLVRDDGPPGKRLVAYVVAEPGVTLDLADVRTSLKRTLPEYMLPSAFVVLEALPLTPNGKLDRRRLPAPDRTGEEPAATVEPRGPVEELLAGIWESLLGVERVGAFDDFFELGGHSLLATQVLARVRADLRVDVPLRAIFEEPTLAGLAKRIEAERGSNSTADVPLVPCERGETVPLSFAQQRLWFFDQIVPGSSAYNIRRSVRIRGPLHLSAFREALQVVSDRHDVLRTRFESVDGRPVARIDERLPVELRVADLRAVSAEEREQAALREAAEEVEKPFDLARAPLFRAALLRLGEEESIFVLTIHHIVSDLWSVGIFLKELAAAYESLLAGRRPDLPELPIQYSDYAAWQPRALTPSLLGEQLEYWKRQLANAPEILSLPLDHPRPVARSFSGARRSISLPPDVTASLKVLSRRASATLYMTLLGGFAALLHSFSGEEDIVIGSPVAGRIRVETERLIGFFLNTLVLRVDLSGDPSFRELLGRVRETALGAYAHQDLPFERLVDELRPSRTLAHNPLFQVWLVLQNAPGEGLHLPEASVEGVDVPIRTARHDLQITFWETGAGLQGLVDYSTDLFEDSTVAGMVEDFISLLGVISERPDTRLSALTETRRESRKLREQREQEEVERSSREILKTVRRRAIVG
ncbi:MAG TPA: amino acid adenylation domain-containing protein [Thermoanaerobaculia bacterium]|nr:amino acid adenylation domain-containing protein [Thermoanaerobaculia bacterium]